MRGVARDDRQPAGVAGGDLVGQAIITAIFRADRACGEQGFEGLNTLGKFILRQEF